MALPQLLFPQCCAVLVPKAEQTQRPEIAGNEEPGEYKEVPEFSVLRTPREEGRALEVRLPEIHFADHTVVPKVWLGPRDMGLEISA